MHHKHTAGAACSTRADCNNNGNCSTDCECVCDTGFSGINCQCGRELASYCSGKHAHACMHLYIIARYVQRDIASYTHFLSSCTNIMQQIQLAPIELIAITMETARHPVNVRVMRDTLDLTVNAEVRLIACCSVTMQLQLVVGMHSYTHSDCLSKCGYILQL